MKKYFGKLLAGVLIVVMTVGSLPNMAYAEEMASTDASYYEEDMDATELTEEDTDSTDEDLSEETVESTLTEEESTESESELLESSSDEEMYAVGSGEGGDPVFWITDKNKPAGKEYSLSKYTIKNGDPLTVSVVPKWENIGETNPDDIPVTYTWYITDYYTGEEQKVEGNNTDSYSLPTDLANNNEYHIDCEASAEYNSKSYDFEFSFWVYKHDEGINPWVNQQLAFTHGIPRDLTAYNMSWDEEKDVLTLSGAYIRLQYTMLLPANSTIVVKEGTTNYIYGRVTFRGEGTIAGEGTLNIINEKSSGDCVSAYMSPKIFPLTIKDTKLIVNKKIDNSYRGIYSYTLAVTGDADVSVTGKCTDDYGAIVYIRSSYVQDMGTKVNISGSDVSLWATDKVEINGSFFAESLFSAIRTSYNLNYTFGQGAKVVNPSEYSIGGFYYNASYGYGILDASGNPAKKVEIQGLKTLSLVGDITGEPKLGETLNVGDIMPAGATVEYQWMVSDSSTGDFVNIDGANTTSFVINNSLYVGRNIKCVVSGTGEYGSTVETNVVGPIRGPVIFDKMYIDGNELKWTTEEILSGSKNVTLSCNTAKIEIVVTGKSENDKISINGTVCNEKKINLNSGDNNIDISVKNSEGTANYKLNVHRATLEEKVMVSFEMNSKITEKEVVFETSDGEKFSLSASELSKNVELPIGTVVTAKVSDDTKYTKTGTVFYSIMQNDRRVLTDDWKSETIRFTVGDTIAYSSATETVKIDTNSFYYAPVNPSIDWVIEDKDKEGFKINFANSGLQINSLAATTNICVPLRAYVKANVNSFVNLYIYEADSTNNEPIYSNKFLVTLGLNTINFGNDSSSAFYKTSSSTTVYTGTGFAGLDPSKDYLFKFDWCSPKDEDIEAYNAVFGDCCVRLNAEETFRLSGESAGRTRYYISNTPGASATNRTAKAYFSIPSWMDSSAMEKYKSNYVCDRSELFDSISLNYEKAGLGYVKIVAKEGKIGTANITVYDTLKREAFKLRVDVSNTFDELKIHPETTSFSYNIYQNTGYDIVVSMSGEDVSRIKQFELVDKDKTSVSEYFNISEVDYKTLCIKPIENYYEKSEDAKQLVKKKSVVYYLRAELKNGSYVYSDKPITIKLSKTAPAVSAKSVSFNSFYSDNVQNITLTSKQGVVYKTVLNSTKMTALPSWLKLSNDGMKLSCKESGYKGSAKLHLNAYVEGYDAPAAITVSVSAASKVPNVKLKNATIKVPADKQSYEKCPVYIVSKDKKVSLDSLNITGVRVATQYDLARLSSKDAKKYAASNDYAVETDTDFTEGCFYILNKNTYTDPVSGTVLLIFTVGNDSKQEFSLPLTVKALALNAKNKWKTDVTSVTFNTASGGSVSWTAKYVKVVYPVDCCSHNLRCELYNPAGDSGSSNFNAAVLGYDDTQIEIKCNPNTPATSSNKPYTLVITDEKNLNLPPLKVKLFVTQKLPTMSFAKNSTTFIQEQSVGTFTTAVKTSDKDFKFDNMQLELTEANSKLKVNSSLSIFYDTWKLYKGDPDANPDDYLYKVIYSYQDKTLTVSQNTKHGLFDNTKDEKYTFVLKYKNNNKCKASFKVTSVSPTGSKGLTLKANKKSVNLNLNAGISSGSSYDKAKVMLIPSNDKFDYKMADVKVYTSTKKDEAHRAPDDAIKVSFAPSEGNYEAEISAGSKCEAGKTYYVDCALQFGPAYSYVMETKPVTIAVKILQDNVKPEVSLKASGYLDINNVGSKVKITPTFKNMSSEFWEKGSYDVKIYKYNGSKDKVGEQFGDISFDKYTKELVINSDRSTFLNGEMQPSGKNVIYKMYITSDIGNPSEKLCHIESKPIVINVKASTAKVKQSTKSVMLYKNDRFDSAYVTLNLTDSNMDAFRRYRKISKVVLDNNMYDVTACNSDPKEGTYTYAIGFKGNDMTIAQKAKAQTIKLKVYLEGSDITKPAATVSVSVKVK
ncbi:MAG: cadherin-like beta sandwich domain-containing protein [Lachnospiraceae bacterium]|nr:cadherin-like beta sandwich domain-containing protein [Candidatus Colinaster equi]